MSLEEINELSPKYLHNVTVDKIVEEGVNCDEKHILGVLVADKNNPTQPVWKVWHKDVYDAYLGIKARENNNETHDEIHLDSSSDPHFVSFNEKANKPQKIREGYITVKIIDADLNDGVQQWSLLETEDGIRFSLKHYRGKSGDTFLMSTKEVESRLGYALIDGTAREKEETLIASNECK